MSESPLPPRAGRRVLVPVANPASVTPLLRCAVLLAEGEGGHVELVTVLPPDADEADRERADAGLASAEHTADDLGVACTGQVRTAKDTTTGVLRAVSDLDPSLVVMGWRGSSSTTDVFGQLIDHIVGRSTVPLAILRLGTQPFRRVLLPISDDHLLPGGARGLCLASDLAARLRAGATEPTTVLRTGGRDRQLPPEVVALGDRVHHDPRRTHQAVGAFARADDLVVAAIAPTVSGLRGATTHLAWAAPDATLLVAVDVGPTGAGELVDAVEDAGRPPPTAPSRRNRDTRPVRITVTVRLPDEDPRIEPAGISRVLATSGAVSDPMAWWPSGDPRAHISATVTVHARSGNAAISKVMSTLHDAPELRGAEISYEVERGHRAEPVAVEAEDVTVVHDDATTSGAQAGSGGDDRRRDAD